ncbi:MAG: hypothetical protein U0271_22140 [Polyangiaceae bacterium]
MAEKTLEDIEKELAEIDQAYESQYSGKDRSSVPTDGLITLAERTKRAISDLEKLGALTAGENAGNVLRNLNEHLALYERELELVKVARDMGPAFERFSIEGSAANFVFNRYNRHFAGLSRDTRDLGLLKELTEELRQIKKRMSAIAGKKALPPSLEKDVDLVQQNIERYAAEEREIPKAQAAGTQEDQANRLAFLANQQFALYQAFFAGQARISRRPALLVRLIDNLKRYRTAMFDLKSSGFSSDSNANNIKIVADRIAAWETELNEIRAVRTYEDPATKKRRPLEDLMSVLGGAANDLFKEYRDNYAGKPRSDVDLGNLSLLIDKIDEIRRQMEELGRVEKSEMNLKNAEIVRDYQSSWVREFTMVRTAQQAAQATRSTGTA